MKICLISTECYPFFYGGIGTAFYFLGRALSSKGHDVTLLTRQPHNWNEETHKQYFTDNFNTTWVGYEEGKCSPHTKLDYSCQLAGSFEKLYSSGRPDLVIYPEYDGEAFFLLRDINDGKYRDTAFAVHFSGPLFSLFHAEEHAPSVYEQIIFEMERYCIRASSFAIAPSTFIYNRLNTGLGLAALPHFILPNPVNPDLFTPTPPTLIETETAEGEKLILYIGRLQKTKGVDLLVRAFQQIVQDHGISNIRLQLIGKDVYWDEYQMSFAEYWKDHLPEPVLSKIDLMGHMSQDEVLAHLKKAWVAVFPSRFEVFGNVALEAINCGVPVLVNTATGLSEVVGPDYASRWNGDEDPAGLAEQLLPILTDTNLRNRLATSSYERARQLEQQFPAALDSLLEKAIQTRLPTTRNEPFASEKIFTLLNLYAAEQIQEKEAQIAEVYAIKNGELDKAWIDHAAKDEDLKKAWSEADTKSGQLKEAWAEVDTKDRQLKDAWAEADTKDRQLRDAWAEIEKKDQELRKVWKEVDEKSRELKEAWTQIEKKDEELGRVWADVDEKSQQLQTLWTEAETRNQQLKAAWEEIQTKTAGLDNARAAIGEKDRLISHISQEQKLTETQIKELEHRLDLLQQQLQTIIISSSYTLGQRLERNGLLLRLVRLFIKK